MSCTPLATNPDGTPPMRHDLAQATALSEAAVVLADAAGERLLQLRTDLAANDLPATEAKRRGDAAAQEVLATELQQRFPEDAVLSEEAANNQNRLNATRVWIIDPLDGTREYSEYDRDD